MAQNMFHPNFRSAPAAIKNATPSGMASNMPRQPKAASAVWLSIHRGIATEDSAL